MKCPRCLYEDTRILDSRTSKEGLAVRRRRMCEQCGYRFTTSESREVLDLMVIKKSGAKERYSSDKLMKGLKIALQKRPVTQEKIRDICLKIEVDLLQKDAKEVTSKFIGRVVLDHLREVDEVAYIRFASIYRDFKTIQGFQREIEKLTK